MGAYTWLSDMEFKKYSKVSDKEVNEALQEVRSVMPEWYINERIEYTKSWWFGNDIPIITYTVYQRAQPTYEEVRHQLSCSKKQDVLNLLYGLYMGYHKAKHHDNS